ncbi:MAG: bifunctional riboflavin kinase/FAD synthetase [Methylophilaceae bacterium]
MRVYRHFPTQFCAPIALAIGNFDGIHLGHQALLTRLVETSKAKNIAPAVMTFEPHPREFFSPQNAPARLTTLREKFEYFAEAKVEKVFICAFNQKFAQMSALDFMRNTLREKLNANTILVGDDFRFGAKRVGSINDFTANHFDLISLPQVNIGTERVSSTSVRNALARGDLTQAAQLLGRAYSISGKVVYGAQRGRQLGFPTANIHMRHERPALTGVYAVKLDGLNAVANLGIRPTIVGVPKMSLEVHVIDFNGDLYGRHVHVAFCHKIRDEQKFENLDALKAQIADDVQAAKDYFKK